MLDRIMGCDSAGEEVGRITQRLKSYCIKYKGNKINLLDTPGHSLLKVWDWTRWALQTLLCLLFQ
ncbi:MAG: hypothetical protein ACKERG_02895 [Candidatus Hodgkinia cicadicola]